MVVCDVDKIEIPQGQKSEIKLKVYHNFGIGEHNYTLCLFHSEKVYRFIEEMINETDKGKGVL